MNSKEKRAVRMAVNSGVMTRKRFGSQAFKPWFDGYFTAIRTVVECLPKAGQIERGDRLVRRIDRALARLTA